MIRLFSFFGICVVVCAATQCFPNMNEGRKRDSGIGVIVNEGSCKDFYDNLPGGSNKMSGEFTIVTDAGVCITVFCDFYRNGGYTYLPRSAISKLSNLTGLYNKKDHAMLRILYNDGEQHVVSVEQLSFYRHRYPLSFQLNQAVSYQEPQNTVLGPYIYLGFLPAEIGRIKSSRVQPIQGYTAAGTDNTFANCDKNPNSYMAFFANPEGNNPTRIDSGNNFMTAWIDQALLLPPSRNMPSDYFLEFEMHHGGCGGFLYSGSLSYRGVVGAAVGLPFSTGKKQNDLDQN